MSKNDADAVRKSFGDVSEHLLRLLALDQDLASELHVFECPMAQGYKKWVQPGKRSLIRIWVPACPNAARRAVSSRSYPSRKRRGQTDR